MNVFTGEMSAEQTRMNELYTTLKAWSDAYYNDDAPLATDEEYDRLMRELKQLEAEHPYWVAEDSPTQNVPRLRGREAGAGVHPRRRSRW